MTRRRPIGRDYAAAKDAEGGKKEPALGFGLTATVCGIFKMAIGTKADVKKKRGIPYIVFFFNPKSEF